jgi:hypothetical protein
MPPQSRRRFLKWAIAGGILGAAAIYGAYDVLENPRSDTTSCAAFSSGAILPNSDYAFFIQPYQSEVTRLVDWLTVPWNPNSFSYGFDSNYQLIRGGNWPGYTNATDVYQGGYHPGMVIIDSNFLAAMSIDYFTKSTANPTSVYNACRSYLDSTDFINPQQHASPPAQVYNGMDRREILLGKQSPHFVYGKGPVDAVYATASQIWYVPGHTLADADPIVTALPTEPVSNDYVLEFFAPQILLEYMQGNVSQAKSDFMSIIDAWEPGCPGQIGSPFDGNRASRSLSYTIIVARSCADTDGTPFWQLPGVQPIIGEMMQSLWAIQESDGGIPTSYDPSTDETPESTGEALLAFDPNLPARFAGVATTTATTSSTA